ncbi:protein MKS1 [Setaria italica]|nr:protein MKS1 [Setaria italica]
MSSKSINMEPSSTSATTTSSSHRGGGRELQGPRPAPLKVRKGSHKIRKPPPQQVREPVIIYTLSPKVVHADASEFMSVVQRLTGATASSSSSSSVPDHQIQASSLPPWFPFFSSGQSSASAALLQPPAPHFPFQLQHQQAAGGPHDLNQQVISPAARLAAIEQARSSSGVTAGGLLPPFPSILSPGSLPAIQPSFFSPPAGAGGGGINLFGELISPAAAFLGAGAGATQAGATTSHQNPVMLQQAEASPSAGAYYCWDLFNNRHHQN